MKTHPATSRIPLFALLVFFVGAALAVPAAAQSPCGDQVTVVYGDTLFEIAQRCGTTVEAMVTDNELIDDPDVLEVGWVLEVPRVDPVDEIPDGRGEPPTAPPGAPGVHVVERGDTLAEIAARYDVPIGTLIAANDIENPNLIHVGQRIALPEGDGDGEEDDGEGRDDDLVTVRGTLTGEGVECQALRTAEGELYTLTGDLGGFGVGDEVEVAGRVARFSICMQGTTLTVESIAAVE